MKPTIIKNILFKLQGQVIGTYSGDEISIDEAEKLANIMAEECEVLRNEIEVEYVDKFYPDELSKTFIDVTGDLVNFDNKPISVNKIKSLYLPKDKFMLDILRNNYDKFLVMSN